MFYQLFDGIFPAARRDIFTGDLMYMRGGDWQPCINDLNLAKSAAAEMGAKGIAKFAPTLFEPHFAHYEQSYKPQLIVDIPKWDTRDRLHDVANCLKLDGTQHGFNSEVVEDIIKAWMAGIFMRLEDPSHQNPMLIFRGPQGCGKDTLIDTLIGGLGQWSNHLSITGNKDDYLQLSQSLVIKISEFERSAKIDVATLKDMVFCEHTHVRAPYDRAARRRTCRASFISSCNSDDIYRDSTGNRRFWPINLLGIDWYYDRTHADSLQMLAQARALAAQNYAIDKHTQKLISDFITDRTPEPIEDELADHWNDLVSKLIENNIIVGEKIIARGFVLNSEAREAGIYDKICKAHKITERYLFGKLAVKGLARRTGGNAGRQRGYGYELSGGLEDNLGDT